MKTLIQITAIVVMLAMNATAEYRKWTRSDGTQAELRLVGKSGEGDEMKAKFRMLNGVMVEFPVSQLSKEDADYVRKWESGFGERGGTDVYDFLKGNLVKLKGDSFASYDMKKEPSKYYLFYYTASWCGPCQAFTPSLVKFYADHAGKLEQFEIILITSDDSEAAMKEYAKSKSMGWPHLKLSKVKSFKKHFKHPGGGIPNLVLTDLEGKILKSSYVGKTYIGPSPVMQHLEGLLK